MTAVTEYSKAYGTGIRTLKAVDGTAASPYKSTGATASVGATTGTGKATATGFKAKAVSNGIDPSYIYAGDAGGGVKVDTIALATPAVIAGGSSSASASAGAGSVGAITGTAGAYATGSSTAATIAIPTTGSATANGYGIDGLTVAVGIANGYVASSAGGTVATTGGISGSAKVTASAYIATINNAVGIGEMNVTAGDAIGGSFLDSKSKGTAATSAAIGSITGYASGIATGNSTAKSALGSAYAQAFGIENSNFKAGYAYGYKAYGGATSTIGKVSGAGKATATGYKATAHAFGIDPSSFSVGGAFGFPTLLGKSVAGTGSSVGSGTGVYGYAFANAQANGAGATSTAIGLDATTVTAGYTSFTNKSNGGTIGIVSGIAKSYGYDAKLKSGTARATGIQGGTVQRRVLRNHGDDERHRRSQGLRHVIQFGAWLNEGRRCSFLRHHRGGIL